MGQTVYKICARAAWREAEAEGRFDGSPDDVRDGFIHLSSAGQVAGTAARHFAGQDDLVLIAFDTERLGEALRWEPSRDGALFPHLYGPLPAGAALWVRDLPLAADGSHCLPEEVVA